MTGDTTSLPAQRYRMWPLYAAGFTTAFGAHGIAANLGAEGSDLHTSLLYLGVLLALYDGAEVILKPVFGTLADRIGARPVLIGVDRLLHRLGSVRGRRRFGVAVARPPGTGRGRIRFLPRPPAHSSPG